MEPLLDAVAGYLPAPAGAASAPPVALVFKVQATPAGRLTFVRVYDGTIRPGDVVWDAASSRTERVARILRVQADRQTPVPAAVAGDTGDRADVARRPG